MRRLLVPWLAVASASFLGVGKFDARPASVRATRTAPRAVLAEETVLINRSALLGQVVSVSTDGLISIRPEARELAKVGETLQFDGGSVGVIVAERCGIYFAGSLQGGPPAESETAVLLQQNLTAAPWDGGAETWGVVCDFLGRPTRVADAALVTATDAPNVFGEPVPQARRRPVGSSLHTGVVAIDALTPIGRGQSMMLFGPDTLPAGSTRTDLAMRIVRAQHELGSGIRCIVVLAEPDEASRAATVSELQDARLLESVRVLEATTPIQGVIAASAACSIAEACGEEDVRASQAHANGAKYAWHTRARRTTTHALHVPLPRSSRTPALP